VSEVRSAAAPALADGEVRLAVERFGLSANNVTYARLGASIMPYWKAFPAPEGYGRVPVWGFAVVEESRHPEIAVGERYYGFLPTSSHVVVAAAKTPDGFADVGTDRDFMHPWYRAYQKVGAPSTTDDRVALFRPLFPAAFTFDEFLSRNDAFGAGTVVITSASAKTAIALATLLAERPNIATLGVTSPQHAGWVEELHRYDRVTSYDALSADQADGPVVLADFTGALPRLSLVYETFAGRIAHTALVGYTNPGAQILWPELTDPAPAVFFCPEHEGNRIAEEGRDAYVTRYAAAERAMLESSATWLTIHHHQGLVAAAEVFAALAKGAGQSDVGNVVALR
jgi:hypothetical protein